MWPFEGHWYKVYLLAKTIAHICMFTRQPWLVLPAKMHKDIFMSKPHSSIIRADVTLVNHFWAHMIFIYRPSSVRAPSLPFFSGPLSSHDITVFIRCRWNGCGYVCDAGWLTAEEKLDCFPFLCLVFEAARQRGGLRHRLVASLWVWFRLGALGVVFGCS